MLCLKRWKNSVLYIGDPAKPLAVVHVLEIRANHVRLGIEADATVAVVRGEAKDRRPRARTAETAGEDLPAATAGEVLPAITIEGGPPIV